MGIAVVVRMSGAMVELAAVVTAAMELRVTSSGSGAGVGVTGSSVVGAGVGASVEGEAGAGAAVGRVTVIGIQPLVVPSVGGCVSAVVAASVATGSGF